MQQSTLTLGVAGLGIMGSSIAANAMKAGLPVHGYDVNPDSLQRFVDGGGRAAVDIGQLASRCDVILTSLPSEKAFTATLQGLRVARQAGSRCSIWLDTSTLPLQAKLDALKALEGTGLDILDCPISGTGAQAVNKDLSIYASGDRAAYDRCDAIFSSFSRRHAHLGAFGNGTRMKLVANLLVAIHNVAAAEAMSMAQRAGLDLAQAFDLLSSGAGNSRMFEMRAPMMVERRYEPATMKLDIWSKDMAIIGAYADELGLDLPAFCATKAVYEKARQDMPQFDTAAVFEVLR